MTPFSRIAVHEASQVGEARRAVARLSQQLGFDETQAGRAAIIVNELANNLVRHARGGRLLVGASPAGTLELLSLDDGPGMADLNVCLRDGYSTAGTPGTGLGAVRRQADRFSAFSLAGRGSVIHASVGPARMQEPQEPQTPQTPQRFELAGIALPAPGETVCGDAWQVRLDGDRAALLVADGLGHGPLAAEASQAAVRAFETLTPATLPSQVLARVHLALRGTRGAAVSVAAIDAAAGTLRFAGIGNVSGRLLSGIADRTLMSQHGTAGLQIRQPVDIDYAWPERGWLVLHSDGLTTRWTLDDAPGLLQCEPIVLAGWLLKEQMRGRDDATVVVMRLAR